MEAKSLAQELQMLLEVNNICFNKDAEFAAKIIDNYIVKRQCRPKQNINSLTCPNQIEEFFEQQRQQRVIEEEAVLIMAKAMHQHFWSPNQPAEKGTITRARKAYGALAHYYNITKKTNIHNNVGETNTQGGLL